MKQTDSSPCLTICSVDFKLYKALLYLKKSYVLELDGKLDTNNLHVFNRASIISITLLSN